jgi:proteasome accessory factor B
MDRLERLLNLVAALIDADRLLTAREIQGRVPGYPESDAAFNRSFSRDKATLRDMGIPLIVEPLEGGDPESGQGYRIPRERYELPDPGLEPEEVAALHLASTAVRLEGTEAAEAIWKLGGVGPGAGPSSPAAASLPGSQHLAALFGALAERRQVAFGYRDERRRVEPWQLNFSNGFWYLTGRDLDRDERRKFRLDRLTAAPELGEPGTFERPSGELDEPSPPWEMGDEEPVTVDVLVDADQMRFAVASAGEAAVADRRADGSVVLRLRVTNRGALRSFVLGLLDHGEILAPSSERDALVAWVQQAATTGTSPLPTGLR